jgi:hypothetical protein
LIAALKGGASLGFLRGVQRQKECNKPPLQLHANVRHMINRNSNSFYPFLVWQIAKFDAGVLDSRVQTLSLQRIPKLNSPSTPADTSPTLSTKERALESRPPHTPLATSTSQGSGSGLDDRAVAKQPSQKQSFARAPPHSTFQISGAETSRFGALFFDSKRDRSECGRLGSFWPMSFSQTSTSTVSDG